MGALSSSVSPRAREALDDGTSGGGQIAEVVVSN